MIENKAVRPLSVRMPCAVAAGVAVIAGLLLTLMGGGHVWGVLAQPDVTTDTPIGRLASLVAIGFVLALPGLLGIALARALWKGRRWAYTVCLITALTLMAYLFYLLAVVAPTSTTVGTELDMATIVVGLYTVSLVGGFLASFEKTRSE